MQTDKLYASKQALTEICNLAKAIHAKRGQESIDFLTNVYFPGISCPTHLANDFIQGLQTQETKQFRKYLEVRTTRDCYMTLG